MSIGTEDNTYREPRYERFVVLFASFHWVQWFHNTSRYIDTSINANVNVTSTTAIVVRPFVSSSLRWLSRTLSGSLDRSFVYVFNCVLIILLLVHSLNSQFADWFVCSLRFVCSFAWSLIQSIPIHSFIHSFIHLFIHLFIHSLIILYIYSCVYLTYLDNLISCLQPYSTWLESRCEQDGCQMKGTCLLHLPRSD